MTMAGEGHAFWPLFDLVVRTPRLEIRLTFGGPGALTEAGAREAPPRAVRR
jgi:hypothetical protein